LNTTLIYIDIPETLHTSNHFCNIRPLMNSMATLANTVQRSIVPQSMRPFFPGQLRSSPLLWAAAVASPFLVYFISKANEDYRGWKGLGAGGVPYNPVGWVIQWTVKMFFASPDNTSVGCYDAQLFRKDMSKEEVARNERSWLGEMPKRKGQRPEVAPWVVPHRQKHFKPSPDLIEV